MADQSAKRMIREWWKSALSGQESIDPKEFARQCADELMADPQFCSTFLDEFVYSAAYDTGQMILSANRRLFRSGDVYQTPEYLRRELQQEESPAFGPWMEHDRGTGLTIHILKMTKEQLLDAAEKREDRGTGEIKDAALFRLAAGKLKSGQIGGDVWTIEALERLYENIEVKTSFSLKGIERPSRKAA